MDSEFKSDEPGQAFDSRGVARHGLSPRESPSEHETHTFAKQLAFMLDAAADSGKFDQLVLVCSHDLLGELRSALHVQVSARLVRELPKDIAKWQEPEVVEAVRKILQEDVSARGET